MIKAVRVLNLFSTILFAGILLLIYAFLPISVDLNLQGIGDMHRQDFFYNAIILFLVFNVLLRLIITVGLKQLRPVLQAWSSLFITIFNVYLTLIIGFIGVWNNSTHIAPSSYAYLNYMGPLFIIFWIGGLIFLAFKKD